MNKTYFFVAAGGLAVGYICGHTAAMNYHINYYRKQAQKRARLISKVERPGDYPRVFVYEKPVIMEENK
jgi:hypothetical protein